MDRRQPLESELKRIKRVSDMMVSMHSELRDKYQRRATILDCTLFAGSIILVALAFVDPVFIDWPEWSTRNSRLLIGSFAIVVFFLALLSFRIDWKARSQSHRDAAQVYSQTKLESSHMLSVFDSLSDSDLLAFFKRYEKLGQICVPIPEGQFLKLKKKHKLKIIISRYLDRHPGTSIQLIRLKLWVRHNFRRNKGNLLSQQLENDGIDEQELYE